MEGCWDAYVSTSAGPASLSFSRLVGEVIPQGYPESPGSLSCIWGQLRGSHTEPVPRHWESTSED